MVQLSSFYKTLFSSVRECYEHDLYCDVKLFACVEGNDSNVEESGDYPEPSNMRAVQCHSLVLCSVAPTFKVFFYLARAFSQPKPRQIGCVLVSSLSKNLVSSDTFITGCTFGC